MQSPALSPAAFAFDAVARDFDHRFGEWRSVSAQRRAVRQTLADAFPAGGRILELGGGTGEDAAWLAERGYQVLLTDASPQMVQISAHKLRRYPGARTLVAEAEALDTVARSQREVGEPLFDGAFSNFAALNCVADLPAVARGLARLVRPNGVIALVMFGPCAPGEVIVELLRLRPRSAFRRFSARSVPARLGGRSFSVRYHRPGEITRAMHPWFRAVRRRGIGIFVPPSAAEPWISQHPRVLRALEALDSIVADRLALLGDHVLYQFERTAIAAPVAS
ncbi:MAG: methyltransferase domain-containing protein [Gemmatimonadaceae bacterium]